MVDSYSILFAYDARDTCSNHVHLLPDVTLAQSVAHSPFKRKVVDSSSTCHTIAVIRQPQNPNQAGAFTSLVPAKYVTDEFVHLEGCTSLTVFDCHILSFTMAPKILRSRQLLNIFPRSKAAMQRALTP